MDDRQNDRLTLEINGIAFDEIKDYTLKKDVLLGCGTFEAEINPLRLVSVCHEPLQYIVTVGKKPVQTGWLDTTHRKASKSGHSFRISGRDVVQLWVDNYILKSKTYSMQPLSSIINDCISNNSSVNYGGKTLQLNSAVMPIITSAAQQQAAPLMSSIYNLTAEPGQTLFDFLGKLCNQLGLVIYATPNGVITIDTLLCENSSRLAFQAINKRDNKANNNISEIEYSESAVAYHAYKKIQGQVSAPVTIDNASEALSFKDRKIDARKKIEYYDPSFKGLMRFRTVTLFESQGLSWVNSGEKLVRNTNMTESRKLFALNLTFHGHAQSEPYDVNRDIYIDDDMTGLKGTWVIYAVEMRGSRTEGFETRLECHTKSRLSSSALVSTPDYTATQSVYAEDTQPFAQQYDTIKGKQYKLGEGATL